MKSKIYMEMKYKIYMAFWEATSTLVLDLGCIQICLLLYADFSFFFPPNFLLGLLVCLLKLSEYGQFVLFPAYLQNGGTAQQKSFIFYVLKLLSKSFSPNPEISTPSISRYLEISPCWQVRKSKHRSHKDLQ